MGSLNRGYQFTRGVLHISSVFQGVPVDRPYSLGNLGQTFILRQYGRSPHCQISSDLLERYIVRLQHLRTTYHAVAHRSGVTTLFFTFHITNLFDPWPHITHSGFKVFSLTYPQEQPIDLSQLLFQGLKLLRHFFNQPALNLTLVPIDWHVGGDFP